MSILGYFFILIYIFIINFGTYINTFLSNINIFSPSLSIEHGTQQNHELVFLLIPKKKKKCRFAYILTFWPGCMDVDAKPGPQY